MNRSMARQKRHTLAHYHLLSIIKETVELSMNRLQTRLLGPDFSSFLPHSYSYEPTNELNSGLKLSNFRFGPESPTASWITGETYALGLQ